MSSSRDHRKQLYEQLVGKPVAAGRFRVTRLLGFGGMGAVYEAIQTNMNRKVALKLIPTHDPTIVARFEREAHTISRLQHPNTITVFDFGQSEDGFLFLSMELLEGVTLTDAIKRGPMRANRAVHIASQMCRSLAEAHRAGIVHRDIKPDNIILIRVDDDPDVVKVLDFGIAKAVMGEDDVQLTGDGRIIGTPRYMSPEQILADNVDHRSDIYSLGCILFEMLCGAPPFQQSSTTALMISHTQEPPPPFAAQLDPSLISQIPGGLEGVVRKALSKNPNDRHRDCDALREDLERAIAGLITDQDSLETVAGLPSVNAAKPNHPAGTMTASAQAYETGAAQQPAPAQKRGPMIAVVVLLGVILALIAFNALKPDPKVEDSQQQAELTTPTALAAAEEEPSSDDAVKNPSEQGREAVAMIHLNSEPQGAAVYEDERYLGDTPLQLPVKAELSRHSYQLKLKGYDAMNVAVPVTASDEGGEIKRSFRLTATAPAKASPTKKGTSAKDNKKRPTEPAAEKKQPQQPEEPRAPHVPRLEIDTPKVNLLN